MDKEQGWPEAGRLWGGLEPSGSWGLIPSQGGEGGEGRAFVLPSLLRV